MQEFIGEFAASLAASSAGLKLSSVVARQGSHGIDQLRRHKDGGFWAIVEAKGGNSRLKGRGRLREMSAPWIKKWIDYGIRTGTGDDKAELKRAAQSSEPMLAAIVRARHDRKTWELKFTLKKYTYGTTRMSWPRGS